MNNFGLDGAGVAAADMESAQYVLDNAKYELRDRVIAALQGGASKRELAEETGLTLRQLNAIVRLPG